jgi:hypothetical protein
MFFPSTLKNEAKSHSIIPSMPAYMNFSLQEGLKEQNKKAQKLA